jgi:hypothetical protein
MNKLKTATAALTIMAAGAAAQERPLPPKQPFVSVGVMGKVIKDAPYSADEITESLQVLADGTRISRSNQVTVYRDGEGRVRRDSPTQITIYDPVANVNYSLDPKTMTAVKSSMARATYGFVSPQSPDMVTVFFKGSGPAQDADKARAEEDAQAAVRLDRLKAELGPDSQPVARIQADDEAKAAARLDKLNAELGSPQGDGVVMVNGNPADSQAAGVLKMQLAQAAEKVSKAGIAAPAATETLGQRIIEGLNVNGTRTVSTIEAGTIGNDRPIQIVSERWYSADLQTAVMTRHSDPRTGEETFRLANVHRGEPGADLFLLPPGYQLTTRPNIQFGPRKEE